MNSGAYPAVDQRAQVPLHGGDSQLHRATAKDVPHPTPAPDVRQQWRQTVAAPTYPGGGVAVEHSAIQTTGTN